MNVQYNSSILSHQISYFNTTSSSSIVPDLPVKINKKEKNMADPMIPLDRWIITPGIYVDQGNDRGGLRGR